jgi:hypothetical protein
VFHVKHFGTIGTRDERTFARRGACILWRGACLFALFAGTVSHEQAHRDIAWGEATMEMIEGHYPTANQLGSIWLLVGYDGSDQRRNL